MLKSSSNIELRKKLFEDYMKRNEWSMKQIHQLSLYSCVNRNWRVLTNYSTQVHVVIEHQQKYSQFCFFLKNGFLVKEENFLISTRVELIVLIILIQIIYLLNTMGFLQFICWEKRKTDRYKKKEGEKSVNSKDIKEY